MRKKSAGAEGHFFHASLQVVNERLTPYEVYSFEPGSDGESKSRIKKRAVNFLTKTPVSATRPSNNIQLPPPAAPLRQNFRWLHAANERFTPRSSILVRTGMRWVNQVTHKKDRSIFHLKHPFWPPFDQNIHFGHPAKKPSKGPIRPKIQ